MHSEGWSPFSYWWYSPLLIDAHLPAPIPLASLTPPCTAAALRPPRPSSRRFAKHGLSNPPPQTPWSRRARQGKTMLIQSATPPTATLRGGRRPPHKGSKSSKHGFYFYRPKSPGDSSGQKPCLSELLPHRDATATPGRPQQPHTAHLISLDFREMPPP